MENREIIGIDHGNRNMKTANTIFSAAVQAIQTKPDSLENILEYQDCYYYIGGQVPEKERVDKTENGDYYLLTLAALGKELKHRSMTEATVKLGAALPPRRFQDQKDSFKKYLSKSKELHFRYEGIHYHVSLENVYVFMQGHVVIHTLLDSVSGFCLLVDIGGGTVDMVGFIDGMPDGRYAISDKAVLYCIHRVNEEIVAKLGTGASPYIIESFMRNGAYDCPQKYQEVITGCLKEYSSDIYNIVQGNNYNLDLTKMVFMGGGASIIQNYGCNEEKQVEFVTDVCANAKGCESAIRSIMRAKQMRKARSV
jgi:plasmid segregation protein ParM